MAIKTKLIAYIKGVCFPLGVTLLLILFIELLSPLLFPDWAPSKGLRANLWQFDERLGWSHKRSVDDWFEQKDFSVHVSNSASGFRDKDYPTTRAPGTKRILLLGDSFGWGYGVEKEDMIDAIIENKYENTEVLNASVAGYGTDQEYLYLKHSGLSFRPDAVLLLFHPNDVSNNSSGNQYGYAKPFFSLNGKELELQNSPVPYLFSDEIRRFIVNRTYFLRQIYLAIHKQSNSRPVKARSGLKITKALLLALERLTNHEGIEFWVVGIPWERAEVNRLVLEIETFTKAQGINYISLEEAFKQSEQETMDKQTQHWTAHGQWVAALAIERALLDAGYLD